MKISTASDFITQLAPDDISSDGIGRRSHGDAVPLHDYVVASVLDIMADAIFADHL